jgi:hypothetical protein
MLWKLAGLSIPVLSRLFSVPPAVLVDLGLEAFGHPGSIGAVGRVTPDTRSRRATRTCVWAFPRLVRMLLADPALVVADGAFDGHTMAPAARASSLPGTFRAVDD